MLAMDQAASRLWNRDFSLLILVQVFALFGNSILSFALPLYILRISGSPALFGTVLALGFIPLVIMSPIGGIIADRSKKQIAMFWMDAATIVCIAAFIVIMAGDFFLTLVPVIIVKLIALNVIQGIYMPTAMSGVPFLVPADKLVPANAASNMVFSLSNAIGPAIAGVLFGAFGLFPILVISAAIFVIAAVIDLFIRIPYKKQAPPGSVLRMVKGDLERCARFGVKEKPELGKAALICFCSAFPQRRL